MKRYKKQKKYQAIMKHMSVDIQKSTSRFLEVLLFLNVGEKIRTPDLLVRRRRNALFFDVVFEEMLGLQGFLFLNLYAFLGFLWRC